MLIKGFQKLTLLDYPGKTACTVFTGGCNFRCPFCHNAGLVVKMDADVIDEKEVFAHLEKRKGILDGIAITGGEPLLQGDIEDFLEKIREYDYAIKLDTNGSFPEKLERIIKNGLCDYIAMDIKNSKQRYGETIGLPAYDTSAVEKSAELIMNSGVDYEFRTTITQNFHTATDIKNIGEWLRGAKKYYLQNFVDSGNLIDGSTRGQSKEEMQALLAVVKEYIPSAEIRGL